MSSFMERMRQAELEAAAVETVDPWRLPLERVRGRVDRYGEPSIERITTATLMDILEVPVRERRAMVHRRIARIMRELHWIPIRVRDHRSIRGENVRGYMRELRDRPHDLQSATEAIVGACSHYRLGRDLGDRV